MIDWWIDFQNSYFDCWCYWSWQSHNEKNYQAVNGAIDHNQYVKGTLLYHANYRAGLRMIDVADIQNGVMQEIAYFDTYPQDDGNQLTSAWSTYPYFDSVNILITDYEKGLFVVSMTSSGTSAPSIATASPAPSKGTYPSPNQTTYNKPSTNQISDTKTGQNKTYQTTQGSWRRRQTYKAT